MKRGTPRHPKIERLAEFLEIELYAAGGLLEFLWHFAAEFAPSGNIGKHTNRAIARAVCWRGDEFQLIEALLTCGWIDKKDEQIVIHDWHEHADDSVHMKLARAREYFFDGSAPRLNRLPRKEREDAEGFYQSVHTQSAQEAHAVHTECALNAHSGKGMAKAKAFDVLNLSSEEKPSTRPREETVALEMPSREPFVSASVVLQELCELYRLGGVPVAEKHKQLCIQYIGEMNLEKRKRLANFVVWAFGTGRWPNPAKTKALLNVIRDGDYDVECVQRTLPASHLAREPSKTEAAQAAAEAAFLSKGARA